MRWGLNTTEPYGLLAQVRKILESAVRQVPDQSDAWAMLSNMYWSEHAFGFNPQPDPLGRALAAARRSVNAAPSNHLAHSALATTLFYQKEFLAFRQEARRAVELNPMDGYTLGWIGMLIAYAGDWDEGCAQVESAMQLNPNHPGWYWLPLACNAYRKGDYRNALSHVLRANLSGNFYTHLFAQRTNRSAGYEENDNREWQTGHRTPTRPWQFAISTPSKE